MIKLKNKAEHLILGGKRSGVAAVAATFDFAVAPVNGWLKGLFAAFGLMGTDGTGAPTQDVILDVLQNGTSIFSGATKGNWSHAKQVGTAATPIIADNIGALTANPLKVSKGDRFQFSITQILNGTSPTQPTDLEVYLVLSRSLTSPAAFLGASQISELD